MKKSDFTGWKDVFRFAFEQGFKQKAYKGFIIFMCIVTIASLPVITCIQNLTKDDGPGNSEVSIVSIYDETGLPIDYRKALTQDRYKDVKVEKKDVSGLSQHIEEMSKSEDSTEVLISIVYHEAGYFDIEYCKAGKTALNKDDYNGLFDDFTEFFNKAKLSAVNVSEEQMVFINQPVSSNVQNMLEDGTIATEDAKAEGISMEEYFILLIGLMVVMFIISFSGSSIATSIVTEKSTRVVEYLMINVRPMALIVGKILSCLLLVIIQFGAVFVSLLISYVLKAVIFGKAAGIEQSMEKAEGYFSLLNSVNLPNVLIAVLLILAGILFYSIIAGVAGASVSKLEEMAEGLKLYQFIMILGSYMGIFLCIIQLSGGGSELLTNIFCVLPISSPFIAPVSILLGKLSIGYALLGLVLLLICVAGLFVFASKVYESLIFYNGKVLKTKDILQIAKNRKKVIKKEEK